jgi:hypothetical protein
MLLLTLHCALSTVIGQDITYRDVYPLLKANCLSCHKSDGIAPLSFDHYKDVVHSALLIKDVISSGYMPPWKADPEYCHFAGERILSPEDKSKIISWIDRKCPKGDFIEPHKPERDAVPSEVPNTVSFTLPFDIHIAAGSRDTNVWVEQAYELDHDTFISSYEFLSEAHNTIHHAMFVVYDLSDPILKKNYEADFFDGKKMNHRVFNMDVLSLMGGWVPGATSYSLPEGIGFYLPRRGIIAYQIHYGPPSRSFDDRFTLRLTYAKERPKRMVLSEKYGSQGGICEPYPPLLVPPDTTMHFTLQSTLPASFSLMAIGPHMHLLGKKFTAWIIKPNGDTLPLIRINDWDFNWQGYYYLPHLMKIEKGSILQADILLDNTSANIRNPFNPPRYIRDGNNTSDEMLQLVLLMAPYREGDEQLGMKPLSTP